MYIYIHIHIHIYICIYLDPHICIYDICKYIHLFHACIHTYVCIYILTYGQAGNMLPRGSGFVCKRALSFALFCKRALFFAFDCSLLRCVLVS